MRLVSSLVAIVLFFGAGMASSAPAGEDDFNRGYDAFLAGQYAQAASSWTKAARQGHARAQNGLGVLHRDGDGVEKDEKKALYWFRLSAENGYAFGMYNLAKLYAEGSGSVRNDIEAHKWLNIASSINFDEKAAFERELLARRMSRSQLAEAERRAQDWITRFFFGVGAHKSP